MRGSLNRWVVALKIARRSALTSWGRSLLIVALIAAPIMGLSAGAVLLASTQSTPQERVQNTLGHAQARLTVVGSPGDKVQQGVEGLTYSMTGTMAGASDDERRIDPRTALPAGTRVLAIGSEAATFRRGQGAVSLSVETGPTWDPSLDGAPFVLLSGRRPTSADEVLLSPAALDRLGAHVGGTITMTAPGTRTLTVVGTSRDRSMPSSAQTVFAEASVLPSTDRSLEGLTFYVPSLRIDWAEVQRLNRIGTTVFSRAVVLAPVPPATRFTDSGGGSLTAIAIVVTLALVFALLEVALLAGSAFLVGARLQQRVLATIASVGADRAVVRRIVTSSGVVLGATGGAVGVVLGVVAAVAVMRVTDDGTWTRYPGLHLSPPLLVGIAVFGVLVGWFASLVPARAASKFDVVRALRGARTPQRVGKKPVLGIVLLVAGIAITLLGSAALIAVLKLPGGPSTVPAQIGALALLGGGPVVAQIGVLLCAGLVLRGVTLLLGRAPLPARLAARDTSRNLGRAVPAVASVMTTVFVASFAMCIANTASIESARQYTWSVAAPGHGLALVASSPTGDASAADAARWAETLRHDLPVASAESVGTTALGALGDAPSNRARDALAIVHFPEPPTCSELARRDVGNLRCGPFTANGGSGSNAQNAVTVGSVGALGALLGHAPSSAAVAALQHGGAVALRSDLAPGGTATLDWFTPKQLAAYVPTEHPRRVSRVAAVVDLPQHPLQDALFVTPTTARTLGLTVHPAEVLLAFTRPPTQTELDTTNSALGALVNEPDGTFITVETGPQDFGSLIAWYVLLACLIIALSAGATAIGLARVDGRADDLTLASLGAAARIRKSVAFVQALIVCGVGALIGTVLGLLPAVAIGVVSVSYAFAPPVLQLALTAIGIPIVIAIGSYLLVGTRKADLTRRAAIA